MYASQCVERDYSNESVTNEHSMTIPSVTKHSVIKGIKTDVRHLP